MAAPAITTSDVVVRTDRHVTAPVGEAVAMMDVDTGTYYLLDDVAAAVWTRLVEPTKVQDLVAELQRRYDVAPDQCEADVLPFLTRLHEKGLVRVDA